MRRGAAAAALAAALVAGCGGAEREERTMSANEVAAELAGLSIRPGLWETSSEIVSATAPGMPREMTRAMLGQRSAMRNCITPEQAARPDANFLAAREGSSCSYRDFVMRDGRMRGTMVCGGDGEGGGEGLMRMGMDGEYGPEAYDLALAITTGALPGGGEMEIEARVEGRRIGDCEEAGG